MIRIKKRDFFLIALGAVFLFNTAMIAPFLLSIFLGWLLYVVLIPVHEILTRRRIGRRWAALITTLSAALTMIIPIATFGVSASSRMAPLFTRITKPGGEFDILVSRLSNWSVIKRLFGSSQEFSQWVSDGLQSVAKAAPEVIAGFIGTVPDMILQLTLSLLVCYFLLVDGDRFSEWIKPKLPMNAEFRHRLSIAVRDTAISSVWATLASAFAQSLTLLVAFLILGLPVPILAFAISFILSWIPLLGVTPVWVTATLFLFFNQHPTQAVIMIVFGLASGLIDNVVRPWVIQGRSDLHPLISLIAIFGHIQFFGILGVFTGPVSAKLLIEFLNLWGEQNATRHPGTPIALRPRRGGSQNGKHTENSHPTGQRQRQGTPRETRLPS